MNGGIYNAALFNASQREARNKLEKMAGIQRPGPSGILASSPELINAVGNAAAPAMPVRATGPATPVTPAPVQQAQVLLPQVPAPTTVTPRPVQQTPAPVMMQEGGDVKVNRQNPAAVRESIMGGVDLGLDPIQFQKSLIAHYGSMEKATEVVEKKVADVEGTIEKTKDPAKISDAVLKAAGEDATDASKRDFARNVFGLQDVNDIDEINRRIADVAIGSSVGKGVDAYAEAVMLGLQTYKQTAAARAAAKSGATASTYTPERLFQQAVERIMANPQQFAVYNDEGTAVDPMKVRSEAMKIAQTTSTAMTGGGAEGKPFSPIMYDASGKPFYSTDGVNYVDAQGNPYVPPKE